MRIGKRHKDCTLGNYNIDDGNRAAHEACKSIAEKSTSLILSGPVGTGKTHLLSAVAMLVYIKTHDSCMHDVQYWPILDLAQKLRQEYERVAYLIEDLNMAPLLVIDDLGSERTTGYILETIEAVVDYRYRQCRATLIGTNLTLEELAERYGNRVLSRWMGDGKFIRIAGIDRRLETQ